MVVNFCGDMGGYQPNTQYPYRVKPNVGAGPARPNGVCEVNGMFGNVFLRMDCRVSGVHHRRGMTGEQARPYGGVRMVFSKYFYTRFVRYKDFRFREVRCRGGLARPYGGE